MSSTKKPTTPCPECGTKTAWSRAKLVHHISGEAVEVPGISHMLCQRKACGEAMIPAASLKPYAEKAREIYRERHGLLGPDEILALRKRLGLSQFALADLLGLGNNTVSRWETGRKVPSASMDRFLRLLKDVPEAEAYLRRRARQQVA